MPEPRRTALATALFAALTLSAGCEVDIDPGAIPVPVSIAPIPSASAGQPKYVCTAIYKILTDGAVRLATDDRDRLRDAFTTMSTAVAAAGRVSTEPAQRDAATAISESLSRGAQSADPVAYRDGEFATIGQRLDDTCV
ncbi:hypothetical protein [Actinoplanes sp. NBRC 101535]|uniref:hypothetical protein n=1 Tax=Actinoplanes sp. NBRC 101535 TaxID=3032196 RepID=UPI00249FA39B|nr:hypothetical protein [Actinoplanes sp. NBRC 101535]GLY08400.1 hypothetical protein Acsp01_87790 [Actinoplanes sp. NBRC 101535]